MSPDAQTFSLSPHPLPYLSSHLRSFFSFQKNSSTMVPILWTNCMRLFSRTKLKKSEQPFYAVFFNFITCLFCWQSISADRFQGSSIQCITESGDINIKTVYAVTSNCSSECGNLHIRDCHGDMMAKSVHGNLTVGRSEVHKSCS